jgi:Zn-dependent M28 family amino/carboxypeptidase
VESVTTEEIAAHIRFLSHDLLEGRGIGSRGGALAELYLENTLQMYGLEPAFGDSYRQEVRLRGSAPDTGASMEFLGPGGERLSATFGDDYVVVFPFEAERHEVEAELVYVGYGIVSDVWKWDDYKDFDVRGKVLVMHVNEPRPDLPELFEGKALTFLGRWVYKYQEAARHGAAGALLIHATEDAGYDWTVVRNSWSGETFFVPGTPDILPLQSWISGETAESVMAMAGMDLETLRAKAQERDFRPVPLGVKVRIAAQPAYREISTWNIAGVVRGSAPPDNSKAIVFSAHHDHLGVGQEIEGDGIYNGAIDNGSALAALLTLARVCGLHPGALKHDLIFFACAAEEEGLLGSDYFARNPPVPAERIVANLNFEMTNVWGKTDDMIAIGARHSDLHDIITRVAAGHGMTISPESAPEQGYFFRSDQFSFARAGIPSVWIDCGESIRGKPEGFGSALRQRYRANTYHRPSDEFDPAWELTGTRQLLRLCVDILLDIDARTEPVNWKPGSPFARK